MVSCPLLTPLTFLCADTSEMCSETGVTGLGSVRRVDFGTLLCPEFTLRDLPRITVRGHPVQSGSSPLRKAPLRSSVLPWSTKRHCGPLAFRRATEGSRVLRRVWGRQEGAREPYGALAPFCLRRETPAPPAAGRRHPLRRGIRRSPLRRETPAPPAAVGTASPSPPGDPGNPPLRGAKGDGIDRMFSCPITSSRFFSAPSHFSRIYASGLRILTVLHDFLKNFYCKSRKHFGQLETHLCENYNSKHRDQPGTAGASGWIE